MAGLDRYFDNEGKIKNWPSKKEMKVEILRHLSTKFEVGVSYTEKQINEIITNNHTFTDYFLLRRELIEGKFLSRTRDGSRYWKNEEEK